jgi:putative oxygen-independent coproporphyrinogen III oxidase
MSHSLYLHIPFCRRKCFYCDFAITTGGKDLQEIYVEAVCNEIQLTAEKSENSLRDSKLQTIFFGGGTPSLLSVAQIDRLLQTIEQFFGIEQNAEISLEVNPGTITEQSLRGYRTSGINRVSLGAQAFQDRLLDVCGRGHSVAEIFSAVTAIKNAGISNFSLDLISGLPNQTLTDWQSSLRQAIQLEPQHLSIYDLIVEPDTAFFKRYKPGDRPLPSEETTVEMYLLAREMLQGAGFNHYEISNYAKPGFECQHNRVYWQNLPFYGVGMAATSYVSQKRSDRPRKMREYLDMIEKEELPDSPVLSPEEQLFETLMQGLRLAEGLDLQKLKTDFGEELIKKVMDLVLPYQQYNWVQINDRLKLTQPQGWLFSDQIITDLYKLVK